MKFKFPYMQDQLKGCSTVLQAIAREADIVSVRVSNKEIIITRVTDHIEGESGVHPAKRAFDARFQTADGYYYTEDEANIIRDTINEKFPRKDNKLTCLIHSFNGGMEHFHFQIPVEIPKDWPV